MRYHILGLYCLPLWLEFGVPLSDSRQVAWRIESKLRRTAGKSERLAICLAKEYVEKSLDSSRPAIRCEKVVTGDRIVSVYEYCRGKCPLVEYIPL